MYDRNTWTLASLEPVNRLCIQTGTPRYMYAVADDEKNQFECS